MALYSVSTRSTWRRRLGVAARAWLPSSRRHADRSREDYATAVTTRFPRRSLIIHPYVDDVTEAVATSVIATPTERTPRHRVTVYPNAYRAR